VANAASPSSQFSAGVTRLAPSPTGSLHLGNARTFLVNWVLARKAELRVLLRVDDLEGPRTRQKHVESAICDLQWLGLDWDGDVILQSQREALYRPYLERLQSLGRLYRCACTHGEVNAASLGRASDGASIYGKKCRQNPPAITVEAGWRFDVGDRRLQFLDEFQGDVSVDVARDLGDFLVATKDGRLAYQLVSVADDIELGITHVVRGEDLLASSARQLLIFDALGLGNRAPEFTHVPLVIGPDGRKLSKSHGDTRLSTLRSAGISAGRVRAVLAGWSGIDLAGEREISMDAWLRHFSLAKLPFDPVVYDDAVDRPRWFGEA